MTETRAGVRVGAPTGLLGASLTVVEGGPGRMSPTPYLRWVLQSLGLARLDSFQVREVEPPPGAGPGWSLLEADLTYVQRGTIIRARVACGVRQEARSFSAVTRAYHAPQRGWRRESTWLPQVAGSLEGRRAPCSATEAMVRSPRPEGEQLAAYAAAWRDRGLSPDWIARAAREGGCGYQRLRDPLTGDTWIVPLESFEPRLGGFPNPTRPGEALASWPQGALDVPRAQASAHGAE